MDRGNINRQCRCFIKSANRSPVPDNEHTPLAAHDALTQTFGLERYPTLPERKRRPRANIAAGGDSPCPG